MSGVPKIEIIESAETLKSLMKRQKAALNHALSAKSVSAQNKCCRNRKIFSGHYGTL
jgi:hypothetical protein